MHVKRSLAAGAESCRQVKKQKAGSADELKIPRHHLISTATGSGWQVSGDYWRHVLVTWVWLLIFRQVGLLKEQISGDFCMRVSWSYGLDLDSQENDNFLPQEKCTSIMLPSMIWFDRWSDSLFFFIFLKSDIVVRITHIWVGQYTRGLASLHWRETKKYESFNCVEVRSMNIHKNWLELGGPGSK